MPRLYQRASLLLEKGSGETPAVLALQADLRALGYLPKRIDGNYGDGTVVAVKAVQHDLLRNEGKTSQGDGRAPVAVLSYNRGRVLDITGRLDQGLAACLADMMDDQNFPKLPASANAREDNRRTLETLRQLKSTAVPMPFLLGMLQQESNLQHFREPAKSDRDSYITAGLDVNANEKFIITSRGYGIGQYTLFHHPPRQAEVQDFMIDPVKNLGRAIKELREKFDYFVNGTSSDNRADDRLAEYGGGPLRECRYPATDPRYKVDCKACLKAAGAMDITSGVTVLHRKTTAVYAPSLYYKEANYQNLPVRANIPCDWPYAARRYNGAGINSYHYQARILANVARGA